MAVPKEKKPTLKQYFKHYYRGDNSITYDTIAKYLVVRDKDDKHYDKHYNIAPEHLDEFNEIIRNLAAYLYSPFHNDCTIFHEYIVDDVSIMVEGSTKPIRIRIKHPDLPDEDQFKKTFYVKKRALHNPRLICAFLSHLMLIYPFNLWVNDHIIVKAAAPGTVASRLEPHRIEDLLTNNSFLKEATRCDVGIRLMRVADMYPKNYVVRRVVNKDLAQRFKITPIDFDHAFLPDQLNHAKLMMMDEGKPLDPENDQLHQAIRECYSQKSIRVFTRIEEERLAAIYLENFEHINLLFEILRGRLYARRTYQTLNKEFYSIHNFGADTPFLGDLLQNSFDHLLKRLNA
ncbi:MAG: hypothetical protein ACI86H_000687 [bacterium]|jgi:hypothetical protein